MICHTDFQVNSKLTLTEDIHFLYVIIFQDSLSYNLTFSVSQDIFPANGNRTS